MTNTSKDYQSMFLKLAPPGRAWPTRLDSNWAKLWAADSDGLVRIEEKIFELIREANPLFSLAALVDWEKETGLPDGCTVPGESLDSRRAAVIAKLRRPGGQSIEFFLKFLGPFGDKVEINESFPPFLADFSRANDRTWEISAGVMVDENGEIFTDYYRGYLFVWEVVRTNHNSRRFRVGRELAGEELVIWYLNKDGEDPNLECRIEQMKPAHTQVIYTYAVDNEG
jgi:uncharacterized protein YmfQ (DUF2313 family)